MSRGREFPVIPCYFVFEVQEMSQVEYFLRDTGSSTYSLLIPCFCALDFRKAAIYAGFRKPR